VDYGSPQHIELLRHAAREANRLGLEFAMHNCPGWSSSGGPWITPELSMQTLTWSETYVTGGQKATVALQTPPNRHDYYRDVMVLAVPITAEEATRPTVKKLSPDSTTYFLEFSEPVEARSVIAHWEAPGPLNPSPRMGTLAVSDDGITYRELAVLSSWPRHRVDPLRFLLNASFSPVKAKYFQFVAAQPNIRLLDMRLSSASRVAGWALKSSAVERSVPLEKVESGGQFF